MTEKRFICYFDDILKKWCVQNTDSLDMHYVADEKMGEEFAHLLNLYQQGLDKVEKENEQLKKLLGCSRKEAIDYCEELMEKDEFIRLYKRQRDEFIEENEKLKKILGFLKNDNVNDIVDVLNLQETEIWEVKRENEQLKKGMIRAVDRYIKNVDCNPPSSAHTYIKIKGALLNIREDLRDLIGDLDG